MIIVSRKLSVFYIPPVNVCVGDGRKRWYIAFSCFEYLSTVVHCICIETICKRNITIVSRLRCMMCSPMVVMYLLVRTYTYMYSFMHIHRERKRMLVSSRERILAKCTRERYILYEIPYVFKLLCGQLSMCGIWFTGNICENILYKAIDTRWNMKCDVHAVTQIRWNR